MQDLQPLIKNLMGFAQNRMGFERPPKLFLKQDAENSKKVFAKTAYYDPQEESVTIFVTDRHPKDILRSLAHELVHHTQNLKGDLSPKKCGDLGPGYAQDNPHMREMERQAYEQGNMCFRDWEDKCKKQLEEVKFLKESKKMAIKISKNELKNLIGKLLKKRINEQKDEFYGRTGADRISSNLDDYEYDRGVEADDDIRRQRARLDKYEREQAGIARDKKEFARQDAENKAFAMGKKWSMGKDYRGRTVPDFSKAKSRSIAYREATRNRIPIFIYKGKTFTSGYQKSGQKAKFNPGNYGGGRQLPGQKTEMTPFKPTGSSRLEEMISLAVIEELKKQKEIEEGHCTGASSGKKDEVDEMHCMPGKDDEEKGKKVIGEKDCAKCKKLGKKCPKCEKEIDEASAKPDFPDVDGDGNTKEPISQAQKQKKEKEGGDSKKKGAKPKKGEVPPQLRKHVQKKKEGQNESKIFTPEKEQELYESRFNNRNNEIFDTLKKLWVK